MGMFNVANFGEISSTNDQVKREIRAQGNEGYVCRALSQSGGYGRQGRLWTSPVGGLYQSILLRPTRDLASLPTLGFVMALSIRAALRNLAALPEESLLVKWPNDIMAHGKKIAGISMEALAGGVCIGMGVNVFRPQGGDEILSDEKYEPAFYEDLAIGYTDAGAISFGEGQSYANRKEAIAAVGDEVLSAFEQCYPVWQASGFRPFVSEYESCSYLQGRKVRMQLLNGNTIVEGTVAGIDENALLLVDDGKRIHAVNSGEAHVL